MQRILKSVNNSLVQNSLGIHSLLPVILLITMSPHLLGINPLITFFIIFILGWFLLHTLGIISLPGKFSRIILVFTSIALLVMNYGFIFSQKASLTLLCVMVSLKFMEIKNELDRRNIFLLLFLGYFILITHFLYSQSIFLGLFALINAIFLTLVLSAFNRKPQKLFSLQENLHLISRLFLKALPIAIVLFLFFPRIPGPLWSLPDDGQTGKTGISDKMYPGSVSELVDSDEIAFRVDFNDAPPAANKLYWRGPVLSKTDGFLWSQKNQRPLNRPFQQVVQTLDDSISYTVTLEPHQQKWLFTLEMPTHIEGDTIQGFYISTDLQVLNKNNIHQLTQYHVTSTTDFVLNQVTDNEIKDALQLTGTANPQTRAQGQQWQRSIKDKLQIVLTALNFFKENPFYYTKKPDIMVDNPSDQFLFDKKRGFCEHYASSFVLLMRAAGIPARVVTGYQGIEKNDVGNYFVVRQSNAHAWAEVWLEDRGWFRVDPTSMVPPERIEEDILDTNPERLSFSSLNLPELGDFAAKHQTMFYNIKKQLNQTIDNIKHTWNNWILGYDKSKQSLFLKLMGFNASWQTLVILLITGLAMIIIAFQIHRLYKKHQQVDRVYRYYLKFINKLNQAGMSITLNEGPNAIKQQAMSKFPDAHSDIKTIMDHYLLIRYADQKDELSVKNFINSINNLKLT